MQKPMVTARDQFMAGVRDMVPILVGVFPFALISGVAAVGAGVPSSVALAMSFLVYAGASQLVAMQLLTQGATMLVIVLTTLVVNLRFVMYSASLATHFRSLSALWKWLLAYVLTDQAYALFVTHEARHTEGKFKHWYYWGAALSMWTIWQVGSGVGILLGAQVPASWSLDFAIPLTFLVLLIPVVKDRPSAAAALTAGVTAVLGARLPYNGGLISAAVLGIIVGLVVEARQA